MEVKENQMNVAICISGLMRSYEFCFPTLKQHLLSGGIDYDIFIHTWDIRGMTVADFTSETTQLLDINRVKDIYKPKAMVVEDFEKVQPHFERPDIQPFRHPVKNGLSLWYKAQQCNRLKSEAEVLRGKKYDWVIRMRPDLFFYHDINFGLLKDGHVHIPLIESWEGGWNDHFAIGPSELMDTYCAMYSSLVWYYQGGVPFHSETMIKTHLEHCKVPIERTEWQYGIVRKNFGK